MSDLMTTLLNSLGRDGLAELGNRTGLNQRAAGKAVTAVLPSLIHALKRNTASPEGARSLTRALEKDHDGSILDNILDAVRGMDARTGDGILGHVLGKKRPAVENGLGRTLGIDASKIARIMALVAPLLMGAVGKIRQQKQLEPTDINPLLAGEEARMKGRTQKKLSGIMQFIDQDGDGEVTDDLLNMGAGLLGRLFKRRSRY